MRLKSYLQYLSVIIFLPFSYESVNLFASATKIISTELDKSLYVVIVSLLLATFYVYCISGIKKFKILKFLYLSFLIRILINPFYMFFKLEVGLSTLCERVIPPFDDRISAELIYRTSQFIILILILKFEKKDILTCASLVLLSLFFEIFLKHY